MDREKVIKGLEICTSRPCYCTDCPYKQECCLDSQNVMEDALALLKDQNEREIRIFKDIWNFIHSGVSTDTDVDQDYVCHEIQKYFVQFGRDGEIDNVSESD